MVVLGVLLEALAQILSMAINIYIWVVIISALITWVNPDPYNPIVSVLRNLTEPVYNKLRGYMPTTIANIDLAPIIVILVLKFIDLFFVKLLLYYAAAL